MPENKDRPSFDELVFPQPKNRKEARDLQNVTGFKDSKLGRILIWTFDIISIVVIAVAASYITALFGL